MDRTDFEPWKGKEVAKLLALVENQRRYYQDIISALPVGLVVLSAKRSVVSEQSRVPEGVRSPRSRIYAGRALSSSCPPILLIENIRNAMVHGIAQPPLQVEHGGKRWRMAILPLRNWDEELEMETLLVVEDCAPGWRWALPRQRPKQPRLSTTYRRWFGALTPRHSSSRRSAVGRNSWLGYAAAHWLKAPDFFAQRMHPEDREEVLALYRTAVQHSREVSAEFRMATAAGQSIWCRETVHLAGPGVLTGVLTAIGQRQADRANADHR